MRLHKFLVDYRESKQKDESEVGAIQERYIFEQGLCDNGITHVVVDNQECIGSGRPSNDHIQSRTDG